MHYRIILLALLLSIIRISSAVNVIDPATAEKVAKNVFSERSYQQAPVEYHSIRIADMRTETIDTGAALYIFNFENGGFVIVSAEDALPPLIGYDLHGYCPEKGINVNFDSFLTDYTEQIEFIRTNQIDPDANITAQWEKYSGSHPEALAVKSDARGVSPLLINLWNQDSPYNMLCPEDPGGPGGHVYAGCVATAMSMVMHYWRYPMQGEGSSGYYPDGYPYQYANYGETEYVYNHMQTEMDGDMPEVALLQYHCGVAVEMMYGAGGSGAYSWDVPGAIKNHFRYSNSAQFKQKENYSQTNWVNLLKEQIDLGQPMYYSGFSNSGGHAFVCDGYDDDNLFHFNFGWSGSSNGFYTLYQVGGFNSGQGAVINFIPEDNYPYFPTGQQVITGKSGSFEDGSGPVENYIQDAQVSWLISPQSPEDSISNITLTFKRFDVSTDDAVTVYDGATESAGVLGTFTGNEIPETLSSTGNELLVVLQSNGDDTSDGFLAEYTSETPTWCNGMTVLTDPAGELSDGSFEFNYDNGSNCKWMITPEDATSTTLYFNSFDTEPENDKLLIYDLNGMELLAQLSGSYSQGDLPDPVTSPSGSFFIVFVTNSAITAQGFEAYYAPEIVGVDDLVFDDDRMQVYPNPANREITIRLPGEGTGDLQVSVFSITGAKVYDEEIMSGFATGNFSVDVSGFLPGLYVVIVRNGEDFYRQELIIN